MECASIREAVVHVSEFGVARCLYSSIKISSYSKMVKKPVRVRWLSSQLEQHDSIVFAMCCHYFKSLASCENTFFLQVNYDDNKEITQQFHDKGMNLAFFFPALPGVSKLSFKKLVEGVASKICTSFIFIIGDR